MQQVQKTSAPDSLQLGITIGSSFAELCVVHPERTLQPLFFKRIYLPSESIGTAIRGMLENHSFPLKQIIIASRILEKILETRLGGSVAQVVTRGFENWLYIRQPVQQTHFELAPHRAEPLASQELIFGVNERINHQGQVLQPLPLPELEFIASKLKMMGVEKVCIDFIFADKNPAHLRQACDFFSQQGFQIYCQSMQSHTDEAFVWRKNVLNACLAGTFVEHRKEIETVLQPFVNPEFVHFIDGTGCKIQKDNSQLSSSLFSPCGILRQFYKDEKSPLVYLGLEKWAMLYPQSTSHSFESPWGPLTTDFAKHSVLAIQPTMEVNMNSFGELDISARELGYEPGPMLMGRALKPTVFDCLLAANVNDEVLSHMVAPTGKRRLLDTLQAMIKNSPHEKDFSLDQALSKIAKNAVNRIALDVLINDHFQGELKVTGVFAPLIVSLLKTQWPEIKWNLCPYSREIDGLACAGVSL